MLEESYDGGAGIGRLRGEKGRFLQWDAGRQEDILKLADVVGRMDEARPTGRKLPHLAPR
ncbi:MAG: hypothetical protein P8X69_07360 [Maritimibacter sp.]